MSSCIKVKGFRNIIHWRVTRYDEPKVIELVGTGPAGHLHRADRLCVKDDKPGSTFQVIAELTGGLLNTRVGQSRRQGARVRRPQVGDQPGRAALTPLVVHGTGFVSRLDGFDSCRARARDTRSAPSPARRSTAPPTKIATKLLSIGTRVPAIGAAEQDRDQCRGRRASDVRAIAFMLVATPVSPASTSLTTSAGSAP